LQTVFGALPAVSVVMPVWNSAATVAEAIGSVLAQTFGDLELICVDDASDDASCAIIAALAKTDPRISLLRQPSNAGAGPARNAGIRAARGRYVAFLDADDLWHKQKLAQQIPWMHEGGHAFTYTAYARSGGEADMVPVGVPDRVTRAQLLHTNVIGCSTVIYDSHFLGQRQMPNLRRRQDFALWLQILADIPCAMGLNIALTTYRMHPQSLSSNKGVAARATWHLYRDTLALNLPHAAWVFGNYAARGFLRHKAPALASRLGWLLEARLPDGGIAQFKT
jgi:teichuronic acid biosynthesis glycosyltransferase TuaG